MELIKGLFFVAIFCQHQNIVDREFLLNTNSFPSSTAKVVFFLYRPLVAFFRTGIYNQRLTASFRLFPLSVRR